MTLRKLRSIWPPFGTASPIQTADPEMPKLKKWFPQLRRHTTGDGARTVPPRRPSRGLR